jgi:anti-sigma factor RsiW
MSDLINLTEPHHKAEELLAWYATGQLEGEELAIVEQHVSSCTHCRRQLAFDRRMVVEFAALTPDIDSGWARVRQRLVSKERWWDKAARDAAAVWHAFNRPAVAAFAVAQIGFVVMAGALLVSLSQPDYRALGSAPPPASANVIAMFRPDTTQAQLGNLLRTNGASLVGGPTPTDAWLLRVPASNRQAVLARLRGDRHVLMAQPVDGADS